MAAIRVEEQLTAFLGAHPVFSALGSEASAQLAARVELISVALGETVCSEGEPADAAYMVFSGKMRVFKKGPRSTPLLLGTLSAGDVFGEQALLRNEPRSATVRAAEDSVLLRIGCDDFRALLKDSASMAAYVERLLKQRTTSNFLRLISFLGAVPARQVSALLDHLEECHFAAGERIVQEGEAGDSVYILKTGGARVIRGADQVIGELGPGDYFGERALLLAEPRFATVIATTSVDCYRLRRAAFESLIATAPQLREQFRARLEQYRQAVETTPPPDLPSTVQKSAPELNWEKIEGPSKPRQERPRLGLWRRPPFIPQEDENDCGAACLAMVARYHGAAPSFAWLRDITHARALGARMSSLAATAEKIGFRWRAVSTDFDHLRGLELPAIAHWQGYHYVVLFEVRDEIVCVGDPAWGILHLPRPEFCAGWTGKLLLLTPTPSLGRATKPVPTRRLRLSGRMAAILALSMAAALTTLAYPLAVRMIVDRGVGGQPVPAFSLTLGLILVSCVLAALVASRRLLIQAELHALGADLRGRLLDRLGRLSLMHFQSRSPGSFLARLQECRRYTDTASVSALTALGDLALVVTAVIALCLYHPLLGAVAILALGLVAGIGLFSLPVWRRAAREAWLDNAMEATALVEALRGLPSLREAGAEPVIPARRPPVGRVDVTALGLLVSALTIGCAAWLLECHDLSLGQCAAVPILTALAVTPVMTLLRHGPHLAKLELAWHRLTDIANLPAEQAGPVTPLSAPHGHISLEKVCFRYQPEGPDVLERINLDIEPNQVVAVVGRSGAGKTTLALLLARFLQATEGTVRLDGSDLAEVEVKSLRRQVSLVGADSTLVAGTVRANIAFNAPAAALDRVVEAAKLAHAHDFILALPQGYDTLIGLGGEALSTGEAQRICVARALFKEPRVLILDDVLGNLDVDSARALARNLRAAARGRTTLLLSRQPLPASYADRVIVLDGGRVVEAGSHRELVEQRGLYGFWASVRDGGA